MYLSIINISFSPFSLQSHVCRGREDVVCTELSGSAEALRRVWTTPNVETLRTHMAHRWPSTACVLFTSLCVKGCVYWDREQLSLAHVPEAAAAVPEQKTRDGYIKSHKVFRSERPACIQSENRSDGTQPDAAFGAFRSQTVEVALLQYNGAVWHAYPGSFREGRTRNAVINQGLDPRQVNGERRRMSKRRQQRNKRDG